MNFDMHLLCKVKLFFLLPIVKRDFAVQSICKHFSPFKVLGKLKLLLHYLCLLYFLNENTELALKTYSSFCSGPRYVPDFFILIQKDCLQIIQKTYVAKFQNSRLNLNGGWIVQISNKIWSWLFLQSSFLRIWYQTYVCLYDFRQWSFI